MRGRGHHDWLKGVASRCLLAADMRPVTTLGSGASQTADSDNQRNSQDTFKREQGVWRTDIGADPDRMAALAAVRRILHANSLPGTSSGDGTHANCRHDDPLVEGQEASADPHAADQPTQQEPGLSTQSPKKLSVINFLMSAVCCPCDTCDACVSAVRAICCSGDSA